MNMFFADFLTGVETAGMSHDSDEEDDSPPPPPQTAALQALGEQSRLDH